MFTSRHLAGLLTGIVLVASARTFAQEGIDIQPDTKNTMGIPANPTPTCRDVPYGTHDRNVLDFWQARSTTLTPLVVYVHGGGFDHGDKDDIYNRNNLPILQELLEAGVSVASVNYRFVNTHPLPAAHHDVRRAVQFLRTKAEAWNLDKTQVGAFGGSAGAQLCMYLAFHDDMSQPNSADLVERESSRLTCVATSGGQTTMDFTWWERWIPEFKIKNFQRWPTGQPFGGKTGDALEAVVTDISALDLVSAHDPPIYMLYESKPHDQVPSDDRAAASWQAHHVMFGIKLKEKMDRLGIEAELMYPGHKGKYQSMASFFITKFGTQDPAAGHPPN